MKKYMSTMGIITGILSIMVAVIVFIFADGLRRYYSGIFFVVIGVVMLMQALRWRYRADK